MKNYTILWLACLLLLNCGCEKIPVLKRTDKQETDNLQITKVQFSPDYKQFTVNIRINDQMVPIVWNDNSVTIKTTEWVTELQKGDARTQPVLSSITNIRAQEIDAMNLNALVLADLTLNPEQVEAQKEALRNLKTLFSHDNLFVSFMDSCTITETLPATIYTVNTWLKPKPGEKEMYRSILSKIDEMNGGTPTYFPEVKQDPMWRSLNDKEKVLIVFSDGNVYRNDNMPIDSAHYDLQERLLQIGITSPNFPIYYINFGTLMNERSTGSPEGDLMEGSDQDASETLMRLLCQHTGGSYFQTFDWRELSNQILNVFNRDYADYQLTYVNPDNKVYRGNKRRLQIECFRNDSLCASGETHYSVGNIYNPIIVNGRSTLQVLLQGGFFTLLIILILCLIFQFVEPYIRYRWFLHKYVTRYSSQNMSVDGILVQQSCYYCKAPFVEGDEIVTKCKHVVHKSCWDENEYKCPEYGNQCKTGSHYYNRKNLLDSRNLSYQFIWVLFGALAGLIAWIFFTININLGGEQFMSDLLLKIYKLAPETPEAQEVIQKHGKNLFYLPIYGLNISFFLTFFLSILSSHGRFFWRRSLIIMGKALLAGIGGYVFFLMGRLVAASFDLIESSFWVDWLPWALIGLVIAWVVSLGTTLDLKRALIGTGVSMAISLGSMYLWIYAFSVEGDSRLFLLLSYMIYSIGLAFSLAFTFPQSKRYFIRIEGPVKVTDIALFKWMNANALHRTVTIGKSVDCNLQMTWDMNSTIAPKQAEICMDEGGRIFVVPLEEGVLIDKKPCRIQTKYRLHHGEGFTIGQT
ncbi:MAG: FHA domain-containing protein, partial [Parabacteroides sp.]